MMTPSQLRELFSYCAETGALTWRVYRSNKAKPGNIAGTFDASNGYRTIRLDGKKYYIHRIIWAIANDEFPKAEIDHINGDRTDNRLSNLRQTNRTENGRNLSVSVINKSGVTGVAFDRTFCKWVAYINPNNRKISLGYYHDYFEAVCARKSAERQIFGEFVRGY